MRFCRRGRIIKNGVREMQFWFLALISGYVLGMSLIIGFLQVKIHVPKLRPYLSLSNAEALVLDKNNEGKTTIDFGVRLRNEGEYPLVYDMLQYDVYIDGSLMKDVKVENTGDVIYPEASSVYSKYFSIDCDAENLEGLVDWRIIFKLEYWVLGQKKKYPLSYNVKIVNYHADTWEQKYLKTMLDVK